MGCQHTILIFEAETAVLVPALPRWDEYLRNHANTAIGTSSPLHVLDTANGLAESILTFRAKTARL